MKERMKQHTSIKIVTVFALLLFLVPSIEAVEVDIPDPNLEAAIREELGIPTEPLTDADMEMLTDLAATDVGIADLTGLEYCINLSDLNLNGNSISDLDPLSGLTNLEVLWLQDNSISDIGALWGLFKLYYLILGYNNINDIGPLSGLTIMEDLDLYGNNISDLGPLSGLTKLNLLALGGNVINDLSPLSGLTNLTHLGLPWNNITSIAPLSGLFNLMSLDLRGNSLSDISALAGLTNLADLYLSSNNISDLGPLSDLTNLGYIWLSSNNISDLSPLSGLTQLSHLWLHHNNISDIQPLVNNLGLGADDFVDLTSNLLNYEAINIDIPTLQTKGVIVEFDDRTPTTLSKISGDGQSSWPNFTLSEPFVVQVLDENGWVFEGVPIVFSVLDGGGSVDVGNTKTDLNGFAESTLTLGPKPVVNTVIVAAAEISTYETFTAMDSYPVMADVLYFMNNAVIDERLFGSGLGQSADRKINAIYEKLEEAERLIEEGLIGEAYGQLREVYTRTDGESRPPDFVAGPAAPELAELIQYLADYLIEQIEDIPDLVVSEIILHSDEISPGDILEYTYTVANIGGEGQDDDSIFDVATYLSTDDYFDADMDIELDWGYSAWEYHLDVGWSESNTENDVVIDTAPGTYYLIVVADAKPGEPPNYYPGVVESNEDNNWRAIQFMVSEPIPEG